jgi:hypothetical protein
VTTSIAPGDPKRKRERPWGIHHPATALLELGHESPDQARCFRSRQVDHSEVSTRERAGARSERGHDAGSAAGDGLAVDSRSVGARREESAEVSPARHAHPKTTPCILTIGLNCLNDDFRDLLAALISSRARFLVVGAHALAVHGVPRATGDLDVWIDRDPANADRVWEALVSFGAPLEALGFSRVDLAAPASVIQLGTPPRRIDILTEITGVEFETAWRSRVSHPVGELQVPFLGRDALIVNKRATGRARDLADLEALGETPE